MSLSAIFALSIWLASRNLNAGSHQLCGNHKCRSVYHLHESCDWLYETWMYAVINFASIINVNQCTLCINHLIGFMICIHQFCGNHKCRPVYPLYESLDWLDESWMYTTINFAAIINVDECTNLCGLSWTCVGVTASKPCKHTLPI